MSREESCDNESESLQLLYKGRTYVIQDEQQPPSTSKDDLLLAKLAKKTPKLNTQKKKKRKGKIKSKKLKSHYIACISHSIAKLSQCRNLEEASSACAEIRSSITSLSKLSPTTYVEYLKNSTNRILKAYTNCSKRITFPRNWTETSLPLEYHFIGNIVIKAGCDNDLLLYISTNYPIDCYIYQLWLHHKKIPAKINTHWLPGQILLEQFGPAEYPNLRELLDDPCLSEESFIERVELALLRLSSFTIAMHSWNNSLPESTQDLITGHTFHPMFEMRGHTRALSARFSPVESVRAMTRQYLCLADKAEINRLMVRAYNSLSLISIQLQHTHYRRQSLSDQRIADLITKNELCNNREALWKETTVMIGAIFTNKHMRLSLIHQIEQNNHALYYAMFQSDNSFALSLYLGQDRPFDELVLECAHLLYRNATMSGDFGNMHFIPNHIEALNKANISVSSHEYKHEINETLQKTLFCYESLTNPGSDMDGACCSEQFMDSLSQRLGVFNLASLKLKIKLALFNENHLLIARYAEPFISLCASPFDALLQADILFYEFMKQHSTQFTTKKRVKHTNWADFTPNHSFDNRNKKQPMINKLVEFVLVARSAHSSMVSFYEVLTTQTGDEELFICDQPDHPTAHKVLKYDKKSIFQLMEHNIQPSARTSSRGKASLELACFYSSSELSRYHLAYGRYVSELSPEDKLSLGLRLKQEGKGTDLVYFQLTLGCTHIRRSLKIGIRRKLDKNKLAEVIGLADEIIYELIKHVTNSYDEETCRIVAKRNLGFICSALMRMLDQLQNIPHIAKFNFSLSSVSESIVLGSISLPENNIEQLAMYLYALYDFSPFTTHWIQTKLHKAAGTKSKLTTLLKITQTLDSLRPHTSDYAAQALDAMFSKLLTNSPSDFPTSPQAPHHKLLQLQHLPIPSIQQHLAICEDARRDQQTQLKPRHLAKHKKKPHHHKTTPKPQPLALTTTPKHANTTITPKLLTPPIEIADEHAFNMKIYNRTNGEFETHDETSPLATALHNCSLKLGGDHILLIKGFCALNPDQPSSDVDLLCLTTSSKLLPPAICEAFVDSGFSFTKQNTCSPHHKLDLNGTRIDIELYHTHPGLTLTQALSQYLKITNFQSSPWSSHLRRLHTSTKHLVLGKALTIPPHDVSEDEYISYFCSQTTNKPFTIYRQYLRLLINTPPHQMLPSHLFRFRVNTLFLVKTAFKLRSTLNSMHKIFDSFTHLIQHELTTRRMKTIMMLEEFMTNKIHCHLNEFITYLQAESQRLMILHAKFAYNPLPIMRFIALALRSFMSPKPDVESVLHYEIKTIDGFVSKHSSGILHTLSASRESPRSTTSTLF